MDFMHWYLAQLDWRIIATVVLITQIDKVYYLSRYLYRKMKPKSKNNVKRELWRRDNK